MILQVLVDEFMPLNFPNLNRIPLLNFIQCAVFERVQREFLERSQILFRWRNAEECEIEIVR
jgi:hypothetical protein